MSFGSVLLTCAASWESPAAKARPISDCAATASPSAKIDEDSHIWKHIWKTNQRKMRISYMVSIMKKLELPDTAVYCLQQSSSCMLQAAIHHQG